MLKKFFKWLFKHDCKYCKKDAVVVCKTYNNKKIYMCSECLRAFRFREKECFKSVLPYGNY